MRPFVLALAIGILAFGQAEADAGAPSRSLALHQAPQPIPDLTFVDDSGAPASLRDFEGKFVLLNVWATWCIPCRKEMPTLDRLQLALGGPDFQVVTLSIDRGGIEVVQEFFAEIGVQYLAPYLDTQFGASSALGVLGLPTTILINRQGQEVGRLVGPAEWDAPEMLAVLNSVVSPQEHGAPTQRKE